LFTRCIPPLYHQGLELRARIGPETNPKVEETEGQDSSCCRELSVGRIDGEAGFRAVETKGKSASTVASQRSGAEQKQQSAQLFRFVLEVLILQIPRRKSSEIGLYKTVDH
jgi:hypothetical protein